MSFRRFVRLFRSTPQRPAPTEREFSFSSGQLDNRLYPDPLDPEESIPWPTNEIHSTKYTPVTFLPQNLLEQLSRPANFYFLLIAVLQSIPVVSISNGTPTILLPLIIVLTISGLKDLIEDRKRGNADKQENERMYRSFNWITMEWQPIACKDIKAGDFIQVNDDQTFPADLLLLSSALNEPVCYVETANLDGETNLKLKFIHETVRGIVTALPVEIVQQSSPNHHTQFVNEAQSFHLRIRCDLPNGKLDVWNALIARAPGPGVDPPPDSGISAGLDHLLLRGSKLRNSGYIYGYVLYTGDDTKIRMNSKAKSTALVKRSSLERIMNRLIFGMFCAQLLVCLIAGSVAGWWQSHHSGHTYLYVTDSPAVTGILRFFTWFIIFAAFVPISLLVSMELVKFFQAIFIGFDMKMAHFMEEELHFARAQTSGLNEELGLVQFILSDKTGTLTCNSMEFRKCWIGWRGYGTGDTEMAMKAREIRDRLGSNAVDSEDDNEPIEEEKVNTIPRFGRQAIEQEQAKVPHVDFNERDKLLTDFYSNLTAAPAQTRTQSSLISDYLLCLALCNNVFPSADPVTGRSVMKSSSPDEIALAEFAKYLGFQLIERKPPMMKLQLPLESTGMIIDRKQPTERGETRIGDYEILALLDFTSKRKRMTVVMREPMEFGGKIRILSKGADSFVQKIVRGWDGSDNDFAAAQPYWKEMKKAVERFGEEGLRALFVASAVQPMEWWTQKWEAIYKAKVNEMAVEGPMENGHLMGNCQDECRRCALEEMLERAAGLTAIGVTAIEDKLQDHVPETLEQFLRAGIRVLMLTGDQLSTAVNIGQACNLIEPDMEKDGRLLYVKGHSIDEVADELHAARTAIETAEHDLPFSLVLESPAFSIIMGNSSSRASIAMQGGGSGGSGGDPAPFVDQLLWIATRVKSVIACRMQPNQKATIVRLLKELTKQTVLAVGDGANDALMIKEASVGVGIRGVEGNAAVQASDYAVSQFSFLRRLLLVHGRHNYRRIATLVCYIFYKTSMLCWTILWFGLFSGFSGQNLFLEWAYQLYNVMFSALPVIVFAVFDRDLDSEQLEAEPEIYNLSSGGSFFNAGVFLAWCLNSFFHGMIVFFFPYAASLSVSNDSSGQGFGLWSLSLTVYSAIVWVVNLKLALQCRSWTVFHHLTLWGSIVVFYIAMFVFDASTLFETAGADYSAVVTRVLSSPHYWLTLFLTVWTALFFDFFVFSVRELQFQEEEQIREMKRIQRRQTAMQAEQRRKLEHQAAEGKPGEYSVGTQGVGSGMIEMTAVETSQNTTSPSNSRSQRPIHFAQHSSAGQDEDLSAVG